VKAALIREGCSSDGTPSPCADFVVRDDALAPSSAIVSRTCNARDATQKASSFRSLARPSAALATGGARPRRRAQAAIILGDDGDCSHGLCTGVFGRSAGLLISIGCSGMGVSCRVRSP